MKSRPVVVPALVSGRRVVAWGYDHLREGKLQHDLARLVGYLQASREQIRLIASFLQELPDHGPCHLPGVVGVA